MEQLVLWNLLCNSMGREVLTKFTNSTPFKGLSASRVFLKVFSGQFFLQVFRYLQVWVIFGSKEGRGAVQW